MGCALPRLSYDGTAKRPCHTGTGGQRVPRFISKTWTILSVSLSAFVRIDFFLKKKVVIHPHPHDDDDDTLPSARVGQDQTPPVSGRSGCAAEQRFGTLKRRTETLQSFCARREGRKNKK